MARQILYSVTFELEGGAKVTRSVMASSYADLVKRVKKTYKAKLVLSAKELK